MGLLAAGAELRRLALTQAAGPQVERPPSLIWPTAMLALRHQSSRKEALAESCVWTCGVDVSALCGMADVDHLDEETRALVEQLCTRAGMLMEDASVQALVRAASLNDLRLKVERSRFAVRHMERLLGAADALLHPNSASEAPGTSHS